MIWATKKREGGLLIRWNLVPVSLGGLFLFAYAEELLWDGLVWRDHPTLFAWVLPKIESAWILVGVVPLLVVPQVAHYVVDAFIWRRPRPAP